MLAYIFASILVVSFSFGFIYAIVESVKIEKRRAKLEERKVNAFEKIADKCDNEETK